MTSPSPADTTSALTQSVSLQFANRPTFEQVAQDMLEQAIKEKYPTLTIDLSKTQLATPDATATGYILQPFMPRVLEYLALGTPVDFRGRREFHSFLSDTPPRRLRPDEGRLDMKVIETLVFELPWTVPIALENALIRYWNAEIDTHDSASLKLIDELKTVAQTTGNEELLLELPSTLPAEVTNTLTRFWNTENGTSPQISRWGWLSDVLKNELHIRGLQQPGLSEPAREALDQIVRWPDRDQRFSRCIPPVYAYSLESTVTRGASSTVLPSHELLLLHFTSSGLAVLLCSPGQPVQSFESLEAFLGHWRERIASRYVVDSITLRRSEISGNAFDTLAAMLLEQQLADLRAAQLPSKIGLQALGTLYNELSDPARYLLDAPRPTPEMSTQLAPLLPEWIKKASIVDQTKFQQYSLALASAKKRSQGRTFLSDITDIKTFTVDALLEHMRQANDSSPVKAQPSQYQLDDIELTFSEAVGAPGTAGYIEKRTMSLIDLAIKNLVAKPKGHLTLSHRQGLTLPAWLTPDFIIRKGGLIELVDIGTTYPRYLQERLLDDLSQVQERERLFAEQTPPQLLLEALKPMLNNERGMTRQGLDLVEAILKPDADSQQVNGRPVVIRHLAFLRRPEAQPDIVTNMFIIEPQDVETGPHLLYGPLYAGSLLEFPTRQALLKAIVTPGALQNSVLTWMSDAARPVYDNGGFLEPHIVHFLQGDEFNLPEKPAPATLAVNGVNDELLQFLHNGELMQYLYGCNARALVSQANRDSVSNSESRWALFLEGSSLLFNALLFPVLRGPVMAVAWLWSLMASAYQDIPALNSEDPVTRELAAVDLLLNLGMLAIQFPSIGTPVHTPLPDALKEQALRAPAPRVIPEQWPAPAAPRIFDGPVALPGEHFEASSTILDLSQVSAHPDRRPDIRTLLRSVRVPRPASLPEPIKNGPLRGLYVIDNKWCALVGEHLYRVSPESDGSVAIIDPLTPTRHVLALGTDAQGNWFVDLRLRLRGGVPPRRIDELRRLKAQRLTELSRELREHPAQAAERQKAMDTAQQVMTRFQDGSTFTEEQRAPRRKMFYELLEEDTASYLRLLNNAPEYARLGIEVPPDLIRLMMENVVNNARKTVVVVEMDQMAHIAAHPQFSLEEGTLQEAIANDAKGYLTYLDTITNNNDRAIHWLELKDSYLEALLNLDAKGAQVFERLTSGRPLNERNAYATKGLQLPTLSTLALKDFGSSLVDDLHSLINPLIKQVRSHSDLRIYDLTPSEQLEILESLSEQYGNALDALQGMKTLYADEINESYYDRLIKLVEGLYQEASRRLAAEVKPEPQPRKRPPKRPKMSSGQPQKKVIKTRKSGVLIGDVKPAGTTLPIEVVELRSETDDQVLATYSRHGDVWDAVQEVRPAPPPQTRLVNAVKGDARKLLGQLDERLRSAESYKKHCRYPQEIEEIMNNEANRFRKLCEELERAFRASQTPRTPADQALTKQLSDAASRLTTRGSELRTELSLQLPPTDGNLQYLFEKELIQVAQLGERKALKGARKDFFQEYAINDRNGSPIWYAHFHYETATTPKAAYSVAHLKTREQRREHYHSMLAKADNPYAVVDVHRGLISKSLAQRRFLPLAD